MASTTKMDLDRATRKAWRRFRTATAEAVATMEEGRPLVVETLATADEHGAAPYVQLLADAGTVLVELSANRFLAPQHRLDGPAKRRLRELGWSRPRRRDGRPNWWVQEDREHADRVAALLVRSLRDVLGVAHPSLLGGDVPEFGEDPALAALDAGGRPEGAEGEPAATRPRDPAHLQELVDRALEPIFGHPPVKDEDGDVPVFVGPTVVFVRVDHHEPRVTLFVNLATAVEEHDRAVFEVSVLNRDHTDVKFVLRGQEVWAKLHVPGMPFAPDHLHAAVHRLCDLVEKVLPDLCVRTGGRAWLEADADE
jgi:hypothetical protein